MATQSAIGWNNEGGLADISKQPRVEFVNYGRERVGGDGFTYEDGKRSCEFIYDYLEEAEYNSLCTAFGVPDGTASAKNTVSLPSNQARGATSYNCWIKQPRGTHDRGKWLNVSFLVYGMTEI